MRSIPGAGGTALRQFLETETAAAETLPPHPDTLADPTATLWTTLAAFEPDGGTWTKWSDVLKTQVLPAQRLDGDASRVHGARDATGAGGRVATPAMVALCLETQYRYSYAIEWR